jgi:hypothetical protein
MLTHGSFAFKCMFLYIIAFIIGTIKAEAQKGSSVDQNTNVQETKFDWSQSALIPVKVNEKTGGFQLIAGGQTINFNGDLFRLDSDQKLTSKWSVTEREFTIYSLKVTALSRSLLKRVSWFAGEWEPGVEQVKQSTSIMDNVLFLRVKDVSFFISLDFPYSVINKDGVSYPPNETIEAGQTYSAHSISIGACRLSGQKVGKFDRNEIEAMSEYVERRFPQRFERPMVINSSITNRMTDVRDGRIFYSTFDQPTLSLHPELVEKDLELSSKLGIEYYQVFEGVADWPDKEKTGAAYRRLLAKAKSLNVRMGDYTVPQGLYCPHYNYEHRALNHPEWLMIDSTGKTGAECLASKDYQKLLWETVIEHNRKFNLEIIDLDFLDIKPCYATNHNHERGDVYKQIYAIVRLMKDLNAVNPNFMVWTNSGNWIELMPKLTWYNPNVYLTDPHVRDYSSHLNVLKNLGDGRREQMVSVHESHFVPYRAFTNCEYYFAPNSRVADTKIFEYSFLQGLAVTPNITLGELRPYLSRISKADADKSMTFISHWLKFIKDNFEIWKHTKRIGDAPGIGAAESYAHILKDQGFIVLVNQNSFPGTTTFALNNSIGLNQGESFSLYELYPHECLIAEQPLPFAKRDDSITCVMPPNSVRIIQIRPTQKLNFPAVYGNSAEIQKTNNGYRFTLSAAQGKNVELGIVLPAGQAIDKITARQTPTVPMYTFPTSVKVLEQVGSLARIEIQFPREQAPCELTRWHVIPGDRDIEFPPSDNKGFLGAIVHNAFSEDYEVQVDVSLKAENTVNQRLFSKPPSPKLNSVSLKGENMTYETSFVLPFIERYGLDRSPTDDAIIELAFSNPKEVGEMKCWLNGKLIPVKQYQNPRRPEYYSFYVELSGNVIPGKVDMVLNVQYLKSE